jgi:hypothetical protein
MSRGRKGVPMARRATKGGEKPARQGGRPRPRRAPRSGQWSLAFFVGHASACQASGARPQPASTPPNKFLWLRGGVPSGTKPKKLHGCVDWLVPRRAETRRRLMKSAHRVGQPHAMNGQSPGAGPQVRPVLSHGFGCRSAGPLRQLVFQPVLFVAHYQAILLNIF